MLDKGLLYNVMGQRIKYRGQLAEGDTVHTHKEHIGNNMYNPTTIADMTKNTARLCWEYTDIYLPAFFDEGEGWRWEDGRRRLL